MKNHTWFECEDTRPPPQQVGIKVRRLWVDIKSSSWLTRNDGGRATTPPFGGTTMSSLHIGHLNVCRCCWAAWESCCCWDCMRLPFPVFRPLFNDASSVVRRLLAAAAILVKQWTHTVCEHGNSFGARSPPSYTPVKSKSYNAISIELWPWVRANGILAPQRNSNLGGKNLGPFARLPEAHRSKEIDGFYRWYKVLTQTSGARQERIVEVVIIYGHRFD